MTQLNGLRLARFTPRSRLRKERRLTRRRVRSLYVLTSLKVSSAEILKLGAEGAKGGRKWRCGSNSKKTCKRSAIQLSRTF